MVAIPLNVIHIGWLEKAIWRIGIYLDPAYPATRLHGENALFASLYSVASTQAYAKEMAP